MLCSQYFDAHDVKNILFSCPVACPVGSYTLSWRRIQLPRKCVKYTLYVIDPSILCSETFFFISWDKKMAYSKLISCVALLNCMQTGLKKCIELTRCTHHHI